MKSSSSSVLHLTVNLPDVECSETSNTQKNSLVCIASSMNSGLVNNSLDKSVIEGVSLPLLL